MTSSITDNLINFLVNKKSFAIGYPGAAAKIVHATDYLLTSCLGSTLKLIAIIDCDSHQGKRATFSKDDIQELKIALKRFAYDAYSKRLAVSIEIWYVGQNATHVLQDPTVQQMNITEYNFWISSWAFDVQAKKVTCNSLSLRNFLRKRFLTAVFKDIIRNHNITKNFGTNSFSLHPELV